MLHVAGDAVGLVRREGVFKLAAAVAVVTRRAGLARRVAVNVDGAEELVARGAGQLAGAVAGQSADGLDAVYVQRVELGAAAHVVGVAARVVGDELVPHVINDALELRRLLLLLRVRQSSPDPLAVNNGVAEAGLRVRRVDAATVVGLPVRVVVAVRAGLEARDRGAVLRALMLDVALRADDAGGVVRLRDRGLEGRRLVARGAVLVHARGQSVAGRAGRGVGLARYGRLRGDCAARVCCGDGRGRVGVRVDDGGGDREYGDRREAPEEDGEGPGTDEVARRRPVEARLAEHALRFVRAKRRDALNLSSLALALLPEDAERGGHFVRLLRGLLRLRGLAAALRVGHGHRDFERDVDAQGVARARDAQEVGADLYHVAVGQNVRRLGGDDATVEGCAARMAEVVDVVATVGLVEAGVQARDGRVVQHQLTARRAPDLQAFRDERCRVNVQVFTVDDEFGGLCLHTQSELGERGRGKDDSNALLSPLPFTPHPRFYRGAKKMTWTTWTNISASMSEEATTCGASQSFRSWWR